MAIRTKKAGVPSEFPPARLFLDDIEEIVRIFRELVESGKLDSHSTVENLKIKVRFSTAGEECDDVQDLPKIVKSFRALDIYVTRGGLLAGASMTLHPMFTTWLSWGQSEDATWEAFHKLEPIFKKRSRPWSVLLQSLPFRVGYPLFIAFSVLFPLVRYPLYRLMPRSWALGIVSLAYVFMLIAILVGHRGTYLKLRNSWEPSPILHYLKDRLVPVVLAGEFLIIDRKRLWLHGITLLSGRNSAKKEQQPYDCRV